MVIDDFTGSAEDVAAIADALAPFPPIVGNYYPGVRRMITNADPDAYTYLFETCRHAAPFIGGAFEVNGFDLVEGSFSLVTVQPRNLGLPQRMPHFDSPDPNFLALLHYLRVPPGSGTAFYRHRATGIERVTDANVGPYVTIAKAEAAKK